MVSILFPFSGLLVNSSFSGAWYFLAGFVTLVLASRDHMLSPWTMGLPFVIGQLLMATIIHFASGESDAEE